jgi:hypothetical protein
MTSICLGAGHRPSRQEGKNIKGRTLALLLGSVGKGVLKKSFGNSVEGIEARNNEAAAR